MSVRGKMTRKQLLIIVAFVGVLGLLDWQILRRRFDTTQNTDVPRYTAAALAQYDGTKTGQPVLLALDGLVYDVSAGAADFYAPGQSYHYLVGKDSSVALHVFGADLIKRKYPVVGVYTP